jgi:tRNA pseudouridine55 synthase
MDASGTVLLSRPWEHVTKDAVAAVLGSFLGPLRQIPPAFSAVKYRGKELYKYARAGKTAEDLPLEDLQRDIEIYSLAMEYIEGPRIGLTVHCSKGTYVRVLATDIAKLLNTAGHVTRLTRIESAGFSIGECVTVEHLGEPAVTLESLVIPIDRLSIGLPTWVSNDMVMLQRIVDGQVVVVDLQSVNDGLDADKPFDILAKTADGRSIGIVEATPILGRNAKLHMKRGL